MKKSTSLLLIIFMLAISCFAANIETAISNYFTSTFMMVSAYFIVKTLEEKL